MEAAELQGITSQKTVLFRLSLRDKKHAYSETLFFGRDCFSLRRVLKSDQPYLLMDFDVQWRDDDLCAGEYYRH